MMVSKQRLIDSWKLVIDLAKLKKHGEYDHDDVLAVIASQETVDAAPEWIPVTERLPEDGTLVLVAYSSGDIKTGVSFSGFLALSYSPNAWADATHWMPLPAPPKEVE